MVGSRTNVPDTAPEGLRRPSGERGYDLRAFVLLVDLTRPALFWRAASRNILANASHRTRIGRGTRPFCEYVTLASTPGQNNLVSVGCLHLSRPKFWHCSLRAPQSFGCASDWGRGCNCYLRLSSPMVGPRDLRLLIVVPSLLLLLPFSFPDDVPHEQPESLRTAWCYRRCFFR